MAVSYSFEQNYIGVPGYKNRFSYDLVSELNFIGEFSRAQGELKEGELLKEFNGIRNAVVHKYNNLEMAIIKEALERIAEFAEVIFKIAE